MDAAALGPAGPLVSCLCVTESRPEFWPWLWWGFAKQDYEDRELVVVDSSPVPVVSEDPRVRVVPAVPGTSVATKRNLALSAARGSVVAWFDDDDWQHPRRLSLLVEALVPGSSVAGSTRSWFVDVAQRRVRRYHAHGGVVFNGLGATTAGIGELRFDEGRRRAADTSWVRALVSGGERGPIAVPEVLTWWLCHRRNLSNPSVKYSFPEPLARLREAVGSADWADTDEHLDRLGAP